MVRRQRIALETNCLTPTWVFYSSNSEADLLGELARQAVSGVFVARREQLDDALIGISATVIGKAVDLNHMRGIAMAEVAEMDVLMQGTIACALRHVEVDCIERASSRTIQRLRESMLQQARLLDRRFDEDGVVGLVADNRLFPSLQKFLALKRISGCLDDPPQGALDLLEDYKVNIIDRRNILAHVREVVSEDGNTLLHSLIDNGEEVIDEAWMTAFRQTLRTHRQALEVVCRSIIGQFSNIDNAP